MKEPRRYERRGLLALNPQAFLELFAQPELEQVNTRVGAVEVVDICGPLEHHASFWGDSYDAIGARIDRALSSDASTVVLKIDSPGGMVAGCFDLARSIRAKAAASGKRVVSYVEGQACSAAYALACAANEVVVAETAVVGSIGVIDTRVDVTAADAAQGIRIDLVTSGARKGDGHPHAAVSADELAEKQSIVDALAGVFFALVADMRGISPAQVSALEARVFPGASARGAGLADSVSSFDGLLAMLAGATSGASMATKMEEARAALEEAAKGDGDEAAVAKRALAAMDGEPENDGEEAEGEPSDDEAPPVPPKKDEEASAVSASTGGALAATVSRLSAEVASLKRGQHDAERAAILASRPDLGAELVKVLASTPLAEVKRIVAAMPKRVIAPAATATVGATRGATQGDGSVAALPPAEKAALDIRMGLVATKPGITSEPHRLVLGAPVSSLSGPAAGQGK